MNVAMDFFSALAESNRRKIVELLIQHGSLKAMEIYDHFPISHPAISQHLKILRQAKLVLVERKAQQRIYRINPQAMRELELWAGRNHLVIEREKRSYTMSRLFDSPRENVWKVVTNPQLIPIWWGPKGYSTVVDEMEVKTGGRWRFIQKDPAGNEYRFHGVYKEVTAPERLTYTFEFELMPGHVATEIETFLELPEDKVIITSTTVFDTLEDLEGMLLAGVEGGSTEAWDQLDEFLAQTRNKLSF